MFTLDQSVGIFIPSTNNVDVSINGTELENRLSLVQSILSTWFGGTSSFVTTGSYCASNGDLILEDSILVLSWATKQAYHDHYDAMINLSALLAIQWSQECIALLDHGKLHLVDASDLTDNSDDIRALLNIYNQPVISVNGQ